MASWLAPWIHTQQASLRRPQVKNTQHETRNRRRNQPTKTNWTRNDKDSLKRRANDPGWLAHAVLSHHVSV